MVHLQAIYVKGKEDEGSLDQDRPWATGVDSVLDLSTQNPLTLDSILLPASAITIPFTDNIPFNITTSGHLILANIIAERVNEELVFTKVSPTSEQGQEQRQLAEQPPVNINSQEKLPVEFEEEKVEASASSRKILLGQKVCALLKKASTESFEGDDVIVGGHNLTTLALFADRMKKFRINRHWSQGKLSKVLSSDNFDHESIFSQSFICRFENMQVTLRAAACAYPHLKRWLDKAETALFSEVFPSVDDGNEGKEPGWFSAPLLDLRDPTSRIACETTDPSQIYLYSTDQRREAEGERVDKGVLVEPMVADEDMNLLTEEAEPPSHRRHRKDQNDLGVTAAVLPMDTSPELKPRRKRKKRIFFNEYAVKVLKDFYAHTPKPTGSQYTQLSRELNFPRESIRVWFCNQRFHKHA